MRIRITLLLSAAASVMIPATSAHAQDGPAAPVGASDDGAVDSEKNAPRAADGNDIVVTAQRRETVLSRTPISATAFSGEDLQSAGIRTLDELGSQTPSFNYVDTGLIPRYRIRGDGLQVFNDTSESPVGFVVDDVVYGAGALQRAPIYDVERVEVLRGPQGTLFGRNTTAGLVQVVTKKPTSTFEGYLQGQIGSFGQRQVEGAVSLPLGEAVRSRVAFYYDNDDGIQRNLAIPDGVRWSARNVFSGRAQLGFDLGSAATLLLKASYTRDRSIAPLVGAQGTLDPVTLAPCSDDRIVANECVNQNGFHFGIPHPRKGYSDFDGMPNHLEFSEYSARLNWNLTPSIELVSITGYLDYDRYYQEDADATAVGGFLGNLSGIYTLDAKQFSQELQLRGGAPDGINWVLGAFYYDDKRTTTSTVPEFFGDIIDTTGTVKTESIAVFGNVDIPLTSAVGLEAGARYTTETKNLDLVFGFAPDASYRVKADEFTWRLGANWRPNDVVFLYATAATGYKSPDFNTTLLFGDASAAAPTDPETNFSIEAGAKFRLDDGRLNFSTAVFRNRIKDKQSTVAQVVNGLPVTRLFNFGEVEIRGAEFELSGRLAEGLTTNLGLALLDTEIHAPPSTTFSSGPAGTATPVDGNELTATPKYQINGLLRYDFPKATMGLFSVQTDFSFIGHQYFQLDNNKRDAQDAYGLLNLRAFWRSSSERFQLEAFVENVTNKKYTSYVVSVSGFDNRQIWWGKTRTWGIRAGISF